MSCEVNSSKETEARSVLSQRNRDDENHRKQNWALRLYTWNTGASFKIHFMGTSLVVQWLRLHAPNTGRPGSICDQGTRSHLLQLRVCMQQFRDPACCN